MAGACGEPEAEAVFPAAFTQTYREVRSCRRSGDHDLSYVRIMADPLAYGPYLARSAPLPQGAIVLKAEHADPECRDLLGYTVMRREAPGQAPAAGDWLWQKTRTDRTVVEHGAPPRCVTCHRACGVPPEGYDWTCAAP